MDGEVPDAAGVAAALALACVHLLAGRLVRLRGIPRSRWLSLAAGVSAAYVFVHLLPELARSQEAVAEQAGGAASLLDDHVYLVALVGLAVFYGVEQHSQGSRRRRRELHGEDRTSGDAFGLSMTWFAAYNAVIGYLVAGHEAVRDLVTFTAAIGVHFVVNDFGLREHHRDAYDRFGRWLLGAAVLAGWALSRVAEVSEAALGLLIAFIAGGVVLNVMKEELPLERRARMLPFLAGAAAYSVLLTAV